MRETFGFEAPLPFADLSVLRVQLLRPMPMPMQSRDRALSVVQLSSRQNLRAGWRWTQLVQASTSRVNLRYKVWRFRSITHPISRYTLYTQFLHHFIYILAEEKAINGYPAPYCYVAAVYPQCFLLYFSRARSMHAHIARRPIIVPRMMIEVARADGKSCFQKQLFLGIIAGASSGSNRATISANYVVVVVLMYNCLRWGGLL